MFQEAQGRLNPEATQWDYKCLPFVSSVAQASGINYSALTYSQTPKEVIATLQQEGRLHPMSEPPPPGAIVLWDRRVHRERLLPETGHAAIATGAAASPYITTKVTPD